MTKEELEKEAEEKYSEVDREFIACQDEGEVFNIGYLAGAEPREKRIAELEDERSDLDMIAKNYAIKIVELEAQIEKMKCCGNCENGELSAHEKPCLHCQRCFASKDVTDQENVKDNWEAIKEIKENE